LETKSLSRQNYKSRINLFTKGSPRTVETETTGQGFDGFSKKLAKHISRLLRQISEMICVEAISAVFLAGSRRYAFFRNLRQDIKAPNLRRQGQSFAPQ
jgi:hypothetical protein